MAKIDRIMDELEQYQEDSDGFVRYFHGASHESHAHIQANGFVGRVEESDLEYTNGNGECIYVAPFATLDQCFEYAGKNGVLYIFEYTGEGHDDVYSNGSGSEYLLPINSPSFRVFGYYDLKSEELVQK